MDKNNRLPSDASGIWTISQSGLPLMLMGDKPLSTVSDGGMGFLPYKRAIDIFASVFLIVLFTPLMLLIAAAIKLSSQGSVLVKEEREGLLRSRFQMLKFRTTETERPHGDNVQHMKPRDVARATSFGKFLRSTELDRLPRLFNILRGDMSLVGPRPHMPGMRLGTGSCEDSIPNYHLRHQVRPGLLGWAQANGYRDQPTSARALTEAVNHDIAYAQNVSLTLDLKIVVRSIAQELAASVRS